MNKPYQLICSYLKDKYYISTIYRMASTYVEMWFYETAVFEWDKKTRTKGELISIEDSGSSEETALYKHLSIIKKLNDSIYKEETKQCK